MKRFKVNESATKSNNEVENNASQLRRRWQRLGNRFLPLYNAHSAWRYSRESLPGEPSQGWKLHISATILEACDLFERVAPFLTSQNVIFKAPNSLDELARINCGLQYGYRQVGKFITVYPSDEKQAVKLAHDLHELTRDFVSISVPFDEQFLPSSSVFYRYGAHSSIEAADKNGRKFLAIKNAAGEMVSDDRFKAVPEWLTDPFQNGKKAKENNFDGTPLAATYKIFRAITQRGKGGTYQAIDLSQDRPRLCVVKEGRRGGELGWNGQDGYSLSKHEFDVLSKLKEKCVSVPQVFDGFEIFGDFYFSMEYIEGKSLQDIMKPRRRRFSIWKTLCYAVEIAGIIEELHQAGWIWNDCKPSNLIVTPENSIRPIDFEGAYRSGESAPFDWATEGFSKKTNLHGKTNDIFALGAVIYFLLTGMFYDEENPAPVEKTRRNLPQKFIDTIEGLLTGEIVNVSVARMKFNEMLKDSRIF